MIRTRVGDRPVNVIVTHAEALVDAEKLRARVEAEFNCRDIFISEFSPVMGYATGPGVLGIASCPEIDLPS
ncbi:MAG: DegV family protein [Chloroflexota bacterium]